VILALASVALVCWRPTPVAAGELPDDAPVAREIERGFNGLFLFTTDGRGEHTIFQRLEERADVPPGADVVCMMRECFIEIGRVPDAALKRRTDMERTRRCFAVLRDAYAAMRRASAPDRPAAFRAWRDRSADVVPCVQGTAKP
jgi:hypothetical protein